MLFKVDIPSYLHRCYGDRYMCSYRKNNFLFVFSDFRRQSHYKCTFTGIIFKFQGLRTQGLNILESEGRLNCNFCAIYWPWIFYKELVIFFPFYMLNWILTNRNGIGIDFLTFLIFLHFSNEFASFSQCEQVNNADLRLCLGY